MPYISPGDREELDTVGFTLDTPVGSLNYAITMELVSAKTVDEKTQAIRTIVNDYINLAVHQFNYQAINNVVGALSAAYLEYERRKGPCPIAFMIIDQVIIDFYYDFAAPYEDGKKAVNGDIPGYEEKK